MSKDSLYCTETISYMYDSYQFSEYCGRKSDKAVAKAHENVVLGAKLVRVFLIWFEPHPVTGQLLQKDKLVTEVTN